MTSTSLNDIKRKHDRAFAEPTSSFEDTVVSVAATDKPVTTMHIRRVIDEHIELPFDEAATQSYGQFLDKMIAEALRDNGQIQHVEFEITDEDWYKMKVSRNGF